MDMLHRQTCHYRYRSLLSCIHASDHYLPVRPNNLQSRRLSFFVVCQVQINQNSSSIWYAMVRTWLRPMFYTYYTRLFFLLSYFYLWSLSVQHKSIPPSRPTPFLELYPTPTLPSLIYWSRTRSVLGPTIKSRRLNHQSLGYSVGLELIEVKISRSRSLDNYTYEWMYWQSWIPN